MLRSSSTPILNSWIPTSKEISSPESDPFIHLTSKTLSHDKISATVNSSSPNHHHSRKLVRTLSETSFSNDLPPSPTGPIQRKNPFKPNFNRFPPESTPVESEKLVRPATVMGRILSSNGLMVDGEMRSDGVALDVLVVDGGNEGGRGGGRRRSDVGGSSGFYEKKHDHGNDSNGTTDTYYQNMIEANPGNSLFLTNYAKFLKEVSGDYAKAEEYCGRSILANLDDGNALAMYAGLIWQNDKDAERAENYFDQALKTSPDDCYVLASYANFLWDAEEEDEEENQGEDQKGQNSAAIDNSPSPSLLKGTHRPSSLTIAS